MTGRAEWVREHFASDVADYLLAGDGFKVTAARAQDGLGHAWTGIFAELVTAGFMRRSQSGRYWWLVGDDQPPLIDAGSPEHLAGFTEDQLRALAASRRPEHIAPGYGAQCELIRRGLEPEQ